jgi:hypothetical protein
LIDREEHIAECKRRALEYLDLMDPKQAFTSMLSDMSKHPETKEHVGIRMGVMFMMLPGWITNPVEVRRWIVGFN